MKDANKTKEQLATELGLLRQRVSELEAAETGRKQVEEALRLSEEKYRTILEEMDEAYFEIDLEGNYTFVNDRHCRVMGYSREETIGMNYRVITPEEELETVDEAFGQAYRTGEPVRRLSYRVVGKDGVIGFTEVSASPMRNQQGEIIGFRGIGRDVTERKQMEEALRQAEERYRTILEEMEDAYFESDLKGNYTFVNDAHCRILGYSLEETIGMNARVITAEEDYEYMLNAYNQAYQTGNPIRNLSYRMVRKEGETRWTEVSAVPMRNQQGEIVGFRGIGHDVTERRQMDESLRQLALGDIFNDAVIIPHFPFFIFYCYG